MKSNTLEWRTEKRKLKDLILFENNPRKMTNKQLNDLKKSIKKFSLVEIPAIDTKNRVIAGNMRIQILKQLYPEDYEIDVRVPNRELTEEEAKEYLLRSNKNIGDWDIELLATYDIDLLKEVGFEDKFIDIVFYDIKLVHNEKYEVKIICENFEQYEELKKFLKLNIKDTIEYKKFMELICEK